jgi:hypothetical protein
MTNENLEIARELLGQIAAAAASGEALALGPQAVKNLQGLIGDLLQRTEAQPVEPNKAVQAGVEDRQIGSSVEQHASPCHAVFTKYCTLPYGHRGPCASAEPNVHHRDRVYICECGERMGPPQCHHCDNDE